MGLLRDCGDRAGTKNVPGVSAFTSLNSQSFQGCFAFLLYLLLYRFFYHSHYQPCIIDINLTFVLNPIVNLSFELAFPPCTSS